MTKTEVIEKLKRLAQDNNLVLPPDTTGPTEHADRTLDSIALLELLIAVEQAFEISLMEDETDAANRLRNIDALAELILEKRAQAGT